LLPTVPPVKLDTIAESPEVVQALVEAALTAAAEVKPAHQDHQEIQADPETAELQALQATQDVPQLKSANRLLHHLAILAQPAHQDHQVHQELPATLDQTANQVTEAALHNQDHQDHQDPQERQVNQEIREPQEAQAKTLNPKTLDQEPQDQPEMRDHQDHQDQQVNQDSQADQAHQDRKDRMEIQELQETMDNQDTQEKPEHQAAPERRVFARNTAPWTVEFSSRMELVVVKRPPFSSNGDLHPIETCPMNSPFLILLVTQKTAIYYVFLCSVFGAFGSTRSHSLP